MAHVVIFAPSPLLTVTVEEHPDGGDVHVHAGGQGVWQARMLLRLGVRVTMCSVLSGEGGGVIRHLLDDEGIGVIAVEREARGAAYVHDRRDGERVPLIESDGDPLSRHDLDELYGLTLREGLGGDLVILSGPAGKDALPPDVYRRLAADFRSNDRRVVVDLAGERLRAALEGGVAVAKVSDEELLADGRVSERATGQIVDAMRAIRDEGAETVIVTRSREPLLMLAGDEFTEVTPPTMEVTDTRGAGDSLTAGVASSLAAGESIAEAILVGAAAGALNVTRHGLGTGDAEAIEALRGRVSARPFATTPEPGENVSPAGLAARVEEK